MAQPHRRLDRAQGRNAEPTTDGSTRTPAPRAGRTTATTSSSGNLGVCPQCGHHFPLARARADRAARRPGLLRGGRRPSSAPTDPLGFFDLRPYTERLAEAELKTGQGDAIVIGRAEIDGAALPARGDGLRFMGGSMGSVVGEKFVRACEQAVERRRAARLRHRLRRRAHAGGDPVADAAAEDRLRGRGPARRAAAR